MDNSRKLTVSYGSFACVLEGFDAPFPLMREIVSHFQALSEADPGFGQSDEIADFEALKARLAAEAGAEIDLEPIAGGVYVRRIVAPIAEEPPVGEDAPESEAAPSPAWAFAAPPAEAGSDAAEAAGEAEDGTAGAADDHGDDEAEATVAEESNRPDAPAWLAEPAVEEAAEEGTEAETAAMDGDAELDDSFTAPEEADGDVQAAPMRLAEEPATAEAQAGTEAEIADESAADKAAAGDGDEATNTETGAEAATAEAGLAPLELMQSMRAGTPEGEDATAEFEPLEAEPDTADAEVAERAATDSEIGHGAPEDKPAVVAEEEEDDDAADHAIAAALEEHAAEEVSGEGARELAAAPAAASAGTLRLGPEMAAGPEAPTAPPVPSFIDTVAETQEEAEPGAAAGPGGELERKPERRRGPLSIFRRKADREEQVAEPDAIDEEPALKPDLAASAAAPFELPQESPGEDDPAAQGKGLLRIVGADGGATSDAPPADAATPEPAPMRLGAAPDASQPTEHGLQSAGPASAEDEPLPSPEMPAEEAPAARSRGNAAAEAFDNRLHASFTQAEPSAAPEELGIPADELGAEDAMTPGGFARRADARTLPDLMAASGAFLMIAEHSDGFSRGEIMSIVQDLAGNSKITAEAKVKAFGKLVRGGQFVRGEGGRFSLSSQELERYVDMAEAARG